MKCLMRRWFSIFLSLSLLIGMMPLSAVTAYAEGTADKAIMAGSDHIEGAQADNMYFGTYKQSSDGNGGYNTDPIKWRVLSNADGKLFLLADQTLEVSPYHTEEESVTWETSTIRSWLNGYGAGLNRGDESGIDYTSNNFLNAAFADREKVAISDTNVIAEDNPATGFTPSEAGNDTTDKVFLLSIQDVMTAGYGFTVDQHSTATRGAIYTDYAESEIACATHPLVDTNSLNVWWLRSPGWDDSTNNHFNAADVYNTTVYQGVVDLDGIHVFYDIGVRPAFNLNKSVVLFTSAATGGKTATTLSAIEGYDGTDWKATLLDSSRSSFTAKAVACEDTVLTVSYENAVTGTNEYISVMIADRTGTYTHYGKIKNLTQTSDGNGSVYIDLEDIDMTNSTVYVFNEQYNGGANDDTKLTDYASELKPIALEQFTVTYDANGHGTAPDAMTVLSGSKITKPTAPTDDGYVFGGWYKESTCENAWDFENDVVTEDITLYAKWTEDSSGGGDVVIYYTVTFDANGYGTAPAPLTNISPNSLIYAPENPVAENRTFGGWYKDQECTDDWVFSQDKVTENITLYAKWSLQDPDDTDDDVPTNTTPDDDSPADDNPDGEVTAPDVPETGDEANLILWISLMIASALGFAGTALLRRNMTK